jgi:hypothetical protein
MIRNDGAGVTADNGLQGHFNGRIIGMAEMRLQALDYMATVMAVRLKVE